MVNCDHRSVLSEAHHFCKEGAGLGLEVAWTHPAIVLRSSMFNQLVTNRHKSPESPIAHRGPPSDSESARQPPMPGTPYKPYSETPALSELPYKPYAEKPVDEPPYEPYKGI